MKKILSLLLAAVMLTGSLPAAFAASDTSDSVIEQVVKAAEIMVGDSSGNLNLDSTVTRAEYAKMLVCASTSKDSVAGASNSSPFKDVPYTHWAAGYIKTAVQQGWLSGYLDGSYKPNKTVTLEEAVTGVLKLLGYSRFVGFFNSLFRRSRSLLRNIVSGYIILCFGQVIVVRF